MNTVQTHVAVHSDIPDARQEGIGGGVPMPDAVTEVEVTQVNRQKDVEEVGKTDTNAELVYDRPIEVPLIEMQMPIVM